MELIFLNTENSKTTEPHRFRLTLGDKRNLKDPNKNIALANSSIYYTWKSVKSTYNNNEIIILLQLGMINLICLMDHIMDHIIIQILNIILNTLLKKLKL